MTCDVATPMVSVIVPVWNEDPRNLWNLWNRLRPVLERAAPVWEMLLIDDASRLDSTRDTLQSLAAGDPRIRLLRLAQHAGQDTATVTGLLEARGQFVCTLDSDLECRPEDLPHLLQPLRDGCDLVLGVRRPSHAVSWNRRLLSRTLTVLMSLRWGLGLSDWGCSFNVGRRSVFEGLRDQLPSWRGAPLKAGFVRHAQRWTEVDIHHDARQHGRSGYTWGQCWRRGASFLLDGQEVVPVRVIRGQVCEVEIVASHAGASET